MPVKDGQKITVEVEQTLHPYTREELKETILKMYPNSEYIQKKIDKILKKMSPLIKKAPSKLFSITKKPYSKVYRFLGLKWIKHYPQNKIMDLIHQNQVEIVQAFREIKTATGELQKQMCVTKSELEAFKKQTLHELNSILPQFQSSVSSLQTMYDNTQKQYQEL